MFVYISCIIIKQIDSIMTKLRYISVETRKQFPSKQDRYYATIITEENNKQDYHFINWDIDIIGTRKAIVDSYNHEELTKLVSLLKTKKDKETVINMYQKPLKDARSYWEKKLTKKDFGGWRIKRYDVVEF